MRKPSPLGYIQGKQESPEEYHGDSVIVILDLHSVQGVCSQYSRTYVYTCIFLNVPLCTHTHTHTHTHTMINTQYSDVIIESGWLNTCTSQLQL